MKNNIEVNYYQEAHIKKLWNLSVNNNVRLADVENQIVVVINIQPKNAKKSINAIKAGLPAPKKLKPFHFWQKVSKKFC